MEAGHGAGGQTDPAAQQSLPADPYRQGGHESTSSRHRNIAQQILVHTEKKNSQTKHNLLLLLQFRNLDVPTSVQLGELLTHLQGKGEEACREFYRALHLHVEEVYYSLPTRLRLRGLSSSTASIYGSFD